MLCTNEKRDCFAKDPAVIRYRTKYYLYYTIHLAEDNSIGVGIATSSDMGHWALCGEIPRTLVSNNL